MNADTIKKFTEKWADLFLANRDALVELDSVAGDGDIGLVLSDGFIKVRDKIITSEESDVGNPSPRFGVVCQILHFA